MRLVTTPCNHPPNIPGLELQELIGTGGTCTVYRAVHLNLQRTVAVKLLPLPLGEAETGPAWLQESRLMASLAHPHVVAVYDAGRVEGHTYLVMEHMAGGSLRARMTPGRPWELGAVVPLLDCVALALEHIHARGVLHLDLKPENILYSAEGHPKISDFGLSVQHTEAGARLGDRGFRGTLDYCAPEYRTGLGLDARHDVFSLATVAYELLTGRVPGRVYFPAARRNPRLPVALDEVLRRGLARDPDERFATVAEFRQALSAAVRPAGSRVPRRAVLASAALAAPVLASVAAYVWWRSARSGVTDPPPDAPVPALETPDRLAVLYDKPADLDLVLGADLEKSSGVRAERFRFEQPAPDIPTGIPLPVWPIPRPVLVIRSPRAWGFVHPLRDGSLGQQVVARWHDLLHRTVPPDQNLVRASGFDGDCLALHHGGALWRAGRTDDWHATRLISIDRPRDRPNNPALLLSNMDPARSRTLIGCYQPVAQAPPGSVLVLRYRARSLHGRGSLAVYGAMPVAIPEGDTSPGAVRIREFATPLPPEAGESDRNCWLYRSPAWVVPTTEWRTYVVVTECPPFPTRALSRNLVIDLTATAPSAADQVWVDDVELFVWQLGNKP